MKKSWDISDDNDDVEVVEPKVAEEYIDPSRV